MADLDVSAVRGEAAWQDAHVKKLFAQKVVLARILKGTMREFADVSADEVEGLIEGEPVIDEAPVEPGWTASAIRGGPAEDTVPGEGAVRFDILTHVRLPKQVGSAKVIVNVEAQEDFRPGYEIVARGVFYAARLVSSQLGVEFGRSRYGDVKKVYSIWVCTDAPAELANCISSYSLAKRDLAGALPDDPAAYDKIEVVVVAISPDVPAAGGFLGMLGTLLSGELTRDEKLRAMEREYNIQVTNGLVEEVSAMSERGIVGTYQYKEGLHNGRLEGEEQGRVRLVADNLRRGMSYEDIAKFLGASVDEVKALEKKGLQPA